MKLINRLVLVVIGLSLLFFIFGLGRKFQKDHSVDQSAILNNKIKQEQKIFKDEKGHWHLEKNAMEIRNNETLKYLYETDAKYQALSEDFKYVKKNLKNVHYIGEISNESNYLVEKISTVPVLITVDSPVYNGVHTNKFKIDSTGKVEIKAYKADYKDPEGWFTVEGLILHDFSVKDLAITTIDTATTVITRTKKIFSKAIYKAETIHKNPHSKIVNSEQIIVNKRKKIFGIF